MGLSVESMAIEMLGCMRIRIGGVSGVLTTVDVASDKSPSGRGGIGAADAACGRGGDSFTDGMGWIILRRSMARRAAEDWGNYASGNRGAHD